MKILIDAQLSPYLAKWIEKEFNIESVAVRDIGLRNATDKEIFFTARKYNSIVITKDIDFKNLLEKFGHPPKIIWLTCGNTSNIKLQGILYNSLLKTLSIFESGENLVEISGD